MVAYLPAAIGVSRVNIIEVVVKPLLGGVVDNELDVGGSDVRLDVRQVRPYDQLGLGVLLGKVEAPVAGPGAYVEHAPREVVPRPRGQVGAVPQHPPDDVVRQAEPLDLFCVVWEQVPWDRTVGLGLVSLGSVDVRTYTRPCRRGKFCHSPLDRREHFLRWCACRWPPAGENHRCWWMDKELVYSRYFCKLRRG